MKEVNLMEDILGSCQKACIEDVLSKINSGAKRLSVAMAIGLKKFYTAVTLAEKLIGNTSEDCAVIFNLSKENSFIKDEISKFNIFSDKIHFVEINSFLRENKCNYKFCIIHDLRIYERKRLLDKIKDENTITISFFSPKGIDEFLPYRDNIEQENSAEISDKNFSQTLACVYETKEVLDIRDVKYADNQEISFVKQELEIESKKINEDKDEIEKTYEEILKKINEHRQQFGFFDKKIQEWKNNQEEKSLKFKQRIKEDKDKTEKIKLTYEEILKEINEYCQQCGFLDKKNQEGINNREEEILKLKQRLKEQEKIIQEQDEKIRFHNQIFNQLCIPVEKLNQVFEKIQVLRESLRNDLKSEDENKKEIAERKFQDETVKFVSELTKNILTCGDYQFYQTTLIDELTQDVWNKLDEDSQSFLITAKRTYDMMSKMNDKEPLDYSGVCLLVTKAVEVEITKRFFDQYKEFLKKKCGTNIYWPESLKGKDKNKIMTRDEFTLGSVIYVAGYNKCFRIKNKSDCDLFLQYATNCLFLQNCNVEEEIKKDLNFIENVRKDYRNPSAHKNRMEFTTAKECLDYVLDVKHMLKEMLIKMKV